MTQNTSTAVMNRRHEPHDSLDFFPTPPWATRALCEYLKGRGVVLDDKRAWEPACGEGHMARPLAEYFKTVAATDVHEYGYGFQSDFLFPDPAVSDADWIITNPPFRLGAQFILHALPLAREGVAVLVRTSFLEGGERYRNLFKKSPPTVILQFCERVAMVKGRCDPKAQSATAYCWLIWLSHGQGTHFDWIPPGSRKMLDREGDYA